MYVMIVLLCLVISVLVVGCLLNSVLVRLVLVVMNRFVSFLNLVSLCISVRIVLMLCGVVVWISGVLFMFFLVDWIV